MNINKEIITNDISVRKGKCFSWSSVFVGALVGIGISFLLNLFGMSIGLAAFGHATGSTSLTFAIGGFLALLIIAIVSMGALGTVAGYLGAVKKLQCNTTSDLHCNYGCLYGFTAWCLALILTVLLALPAGKFINYTTRALSDPTLVLTSDVYTKHDVTQTKVLPTTAPGTTEETAKQLAVTTFIAFIIFFIGALAAAIAGHIAFERCTRKHGDFRRRDIR
jgi:hypothetical protein